MRLERKSFFRMKERESKREDNFQRWLNGSEKKRSWKSQLKF